MVSLVLHLLIAFIWLFLSPTRNLPSLIIGLVIGWGILFVFRSLLPGDRYLVRSIAFWQWLLKFLRAFVSSQLRVAQIVLFPKRFAIHPDYLDFPLPPDLTDFEKLVLTHTISLTPGTTSVEIIEEGNRLVVHALEASDPEAIFRDINTNLLQPLLKVTRS